MRSPCHGRSCQSPGWMSYLRHTSFSGPGLDIQEACAAYTLSTGETLAQASAVQPLAVVFLRHFGCTFTRQILREMESLKTDAQSHGARLVLVHMLQEGKEMTYLDGRSGIARIADPKCELYRAFGLGKGGLLELFGPRVWLPMLNLLLRGCGLGLPAGDGSQMPGAFVLKEAAIVASQRPRSQAFLPDLSRLFSGSPGAAMELQEIPA